MGDNDDLRGLVDVGDNDDLRGLVDVGDDGDDFRLLFVVGDEDLRGLFSDLLRSTRSRGGLFCTDGLA